MQSSVLHHSVSKECLPVPGEKLETVLTRVAPLTVSVLTSAEHIRNFVRSSV